MQCTSIVLNTYKLPLQIIVFIANNVLNSENGTVGHLFSMFTLNLMQNLFEHVLNSNNMHFIVHWFFVR